VPRPGTEIRIVDGAAGGGPVLDTGQAFFAGVASRGPTDKAVKVASTPEYETKYGPRSGGSLLYDAVASFFAEGGGTLYVARVSGAGAEPAEVAFGSLTATAQSPGAWGNEISVESVAGTGAGFVVKVYDDDKLVDQSPELMTATAAAAWSQDRLVEFTKGADDTLGVIAKVNLAGGADGSAPAAGDVQAALDRFEYGLGPGQVAAPGYTSTVMHEALLEHADTQRRVALLDLPDTADPPALVAAVQALATVKGVRYASALAPWLSYPGPAGAPVTIPYSGVQAALIARADATTGNPNQVAAGTNGIHRGTLGLSHEFADDDRQAMNEQGVTLAKEKYGSYRTYGGRTAAGPADTNWLPFGNSRVIMAIAHEADAVAENYVFKQIDGGRRIFAALEADLGGICLRYFNLGALFGASAEEAFNVDTGEQVNTIDTIKAQEIHAVIRLKASPFGEWVAIDIVKVPVQQALAA
jgi:Phage tail sheath protein subtilisin-like domain